MTLSYKLNINSYVQRDKVPRLHTPAKRTLNSARMAEDSSAGPSVHPALDLPAPLASLILFPVTGRSFCACWRWCSPAGGRMWLPATASRMVVDAAATHKPTHISNPTKPEVGMCRGLCRREESSGTCCLQLNDKRRRGGVVKKSSVD